MTKPKSGADKNAKLFDELCLAIGLLTEAASPSDSKPDLNVDWLMLPLATSKGFATSTETPQRSHLLKAVASLLGDEDRRGRKPLPSDDASPWWYYLASTAKKPKPLSGDPNQHVPIDLVLADTGVPAIGVGAKYEQQLVWPAVGVEPKLGVLLWIRAWLLGLDGPTTPLVQPLDAKMRPQLEGAVRLDLPTGFLSSVAITGGLRLPTTTGTPAVGIDATLSLAGWEPQVGATPRQAAKPETFALKFGNDVSGDPKQYLKVAVRLALFIARTFIVHEASKPGDPPNVARRLLDHLLPLFGSATPTGNPIAAFPLDKIVDGDTGALATWAAQFNPVKKPPFDWNTDAPAAALMHLYCLFKKQDPDPKALAGGSLVAWLTGDDTAGGFGLHLDGDLQVGNKGWVSVGLVARKTLAGPVGSNVRARIDVAATLVRAAFDGYTVGGPAPEAPTLTGPSFDITLALEPVNGNQLVTIAIDGPTGTVSATLARAKLTLRWRPGPAVELGWRFETETDLRALDPAKVATAAIAVLRAQLDGPVLDLIDLALATTATPDQLLDKVYSLAPTVAGTIDGVELRLTPSVGATKGLTLKAGSAITATLGAAGATVKAEIPIPVFDGRMRLALKLAADGGKLALGLRIGAGDDVVTVPLSLAAIDETYVLTLVKHLAVPALTAASLDAALLQQEFATGVTLGQLLGWARVVKNTTPGGAATWAMANLTDLVKREALQVVADLAAGLAQLRKDGVDVGDVNLKPAITTAGAKTSYGVALARTVATPGTPPEPFTLFDTGDVRAGLTAIDLTGLAIADGKPTLAPALHAQGLFIESGSKEDPLLASELLSVESARLSADLSLGADTGVKVTQVAIDLRKLQLPFGKKAGELASGLFAKRAKDNPGFAVGFAYGAGGFKIQLPAEPQWIKLDTQIGPVSLDRLGLKAAKQADGTEHLYVLLDAGFKLGPIAVSASGLGVHFAPADLGTPSKWQFTLDGLGLALDAGPVSMSGFLQRTKVDNQEEFRGAALITFAGYQIGAVGAYRQLRDSTNEEHPSLFVFGALNAPLGGPPFFLVTGVAGGFGVNRKLVIDDDPAKLKDHVFFQVMEGKQDSLADVGKMGEALGKALPAEQGAAWFAAGVKFTSFSLIKGVALLYLRFGRTFELGIFAKATFNVPDPEPTIASVTLVLKGAFTAGDDPRLLVRADLVESWLLSKDCKLTGSFAFGLWPKRGDCLLTVGGFHKDYVPAGHYPTGLSRLGFSWAISDSIKAEGQAYFALTPREAMAGASLSVAGTWGPLAAGFDAWFDAWIGWDPFWFDLQLGVRIWAQVFGVRASLGVSLHLWGPPVGGTATIEVMFWSFTIPFGSTARLSSAPLPFGRFVSKHLELTLPPPLEQASSGLKVRGRTIGGPAGDGEPAQRGLIALQVTEGAQAVPERGADAAATVADGSPGRPFRVSPEFVLEIRSKIPVSLALYTATAGTFTMQAKSPSSFGFAPCGLTIEGASDASSLTIRHGGTAHVKLTSSQVTLLPPTPMPRALFDTAVANGKPSPSSTIPLSMGIRIDGRARMNDSAGVTRMTPELSNNEQRIPLVWNPTMLVNAPNPGDAPGPTDPGGVQGLAHVPPDPDTVWGPPETSASVAVPVAAVAAPVAVPVAAVAAPVAPVAVPVVPAGAIGARITEVQPASPVTVTSTAAIDDAHALPEVVIEAPGERTAAVAEVGLHDLRPSEARAEPTAVRVGTVAGAGLAVDTKALLSDGLTLTGGEAVTLHALAAGATLEGRTDQALQVLWVGGFGTPLANLRVELDDKSARLRLVAPAGSQRALVRGLGRDEGDVARQPLPAGFDARTVAIRIGDRAWWAQDCMIGLGDGEPVAGQPTVARASSVTSGASAIRLWFVPAIVVGPDGAVPERGEPEATREPGRVLAITVAVDDPTLAAEPAGLARWRRREGELGEPRLAGDGRSVTMMWPLDDDLPCTVTGELAAGVRLVAAALVPRGRPDLRERLLDDGRPVVFTDLALPTGGRTLLRLDLTAEVTS